MFDKNIRKKYEHQPEKCVQDFAPEKCKALHALVWQQLKNMFFRSFLTADFSDILPHALLAARLFCFTRGCRRHRPDRSLSIHIWNRIC